MPGPRYEVGVPYAYRDMCLQAPLFSHVLLTEFAARISHDSVLRQIHIVMLFMQVGNEFRSRERDTKSFAATM